MLRQNVCMHVVVVDVESNKKTFKIEDEKKWITIEVHARYNYFSNEHTTYCSRGVTPLEQTHTHRIIHLKKEQDEKFGMWKS